MYTLHEQMSLIKEDPRNIRLIKNQHQKIKIEVARYRELYQYIIDPDEEVQQELLFFNNQAIDKIENPSMKMQILAVKLCGCNLSNVKNPTLEIKKMAAYQNHYSIRDVDSEPEEIQKIIATRRDGYLSLISKPSLNIILDALYYDTSNIRYISNRTNPILSIYHVLNYDSIYYPVHYNTYKYILSRYKSYPLRNKKLPIHLKMLTVQDTEMMKNMENPDILFRYQ